jgi:hypothetical protein
MTRIPGVLGVEHQDLGAVPQQGGDFFPAYVRILVRGRSAGLEGLSAAALVLRV